MSRYTSEQMTKDYTIIRMLKTSGRNQMAKKEYYKRL